MEKVLIVFGSKSDEHIFNGIIEVLKEKGVAYEARVCSAHRTPDELDVLLSQGFSVVIAGAGLAAHLPGVCASKTVSPIIGVPVKSNYHGLDALLSVMQMPPGIPVLSVGVDRSAIAAQQAALMLKEYDKVHLMGEKSKAMEKAIAILDEFEVPYEINQGFTANSLNINFIPLDEPSKESEDLMIHVPVMDKEHDKAEAALNTLKNSQHGLWVGLNRGENAALAAIEVMGIKNPLSKKFKEYRKKQAAKIALDDAEVKKR